jgi:hypothetical protein
MRRDVKLLTDDHAGNSTRSNVVRARGFWAESDPIPGGDEHRDPTVTAIPVVSSNTRVTNSDRLMEGMSDWQEAATMVTKARARANSLVLM